MVELQGRGAQSAKQGPPIDATAAEHTGKEECRWLIERTTGKVSIFHVAIVLRYLDSQRSIEQLVDDLRIDLGETYLEEHAC